MKYHASSVKTLWAETLKPYKNMHKCKYSPFYPWQLGRLHGCFWRRWRLEWGRYGAYRFVQIGPLEVGWLHG